MAMCLLQLGRPQRSRAHLDAARSYYEATSNHERLVDCMALEIGYACQTQAMNAVELGNRALVACRELQPSSPMLEVRILGLLASAYVTIGDWLHAIGAYEQAIKLAGPLFDMRRRARLLNDAAIAYKEIGRFDVAARHITQAVALFKATREPVMLAKAENNFGVILMAMGNPAEARPHLERSLALCVQTGLEAGRAHVLISLAELCLAEGRLEPARQFATHALDFAERLHENDSRAAAHFWLGRIAASAGNRKACDQEFALAIRDWEAAGAHEWLARCHETYADALEKRGDIDLANAELKTALAVRSRQPA
jgi:tetratricopeptide (TPR) repeat protein